MPPGNGYSQKRVDGLVKICRFATNLDSAEKHPWTHMIARCGMFDPRGDKNASDGDGGTRTLMQYTATCSEVVSLRKGDILYIEHGEVSHNGRITSICEHSTNPSTINRLTLIKVFGNSLARFDQLRKPNGKRADEPRRIATWKKSITDFPSTIFEPKLLCDGTKIEMSTATEPGYCLVLGRVASMLKKKEYKKPFGRFGVMEDSQSVEVRITTSGGRPLHANSAIAFDMAHDQDSHHSSPEHIIDYGSINDVVFLSKGNRISVETNGVHRDQLCLSDHGTSPPLFGKAITQNLFLLMLSPSMQVERYNVTTHMENGILFERTMMTPNDDVHNTNNDSIIAPQRPPLFEVREGDYDDELHAELIASSDVFSRKESNSKEESVGVPLIVIGSVPCNEISRCCLFINDTMVALSNIPEVEQSSPMHQRHVFHEVVTLKMGDIVSIRGQSGDVIDIEGTRHDGHLAFIVLE